MKANIRLEEMYRFPVFQTREQYEQQTGQPCPPWEPTLPPKAWFDPQAASSPHALIGYAVLSPGEDGNGWDRGVDGKPRVITWNLGRGLAGRVNIPPKGPGSTNTPGTDQPEVPIPVKPLTATQEWVFVAFGTGSKPWVYDSTKPNAFPDDEPVSGGGGFTDADRALLQGIGKALGV